MNISVNVMKLPLIMCCHAAMIIRYGEKYQMVIGKRSIEKISKNLRIFCKVMESSLPSKLCINFVYIIAK